MSSFPEHASQLAQTLEEKTVMFMDDCQTARGVVNSTPPTGRRNRVMQPAGLSAPINIVHDVTLEVLEDDPYPTYAWMRRHRPIAYVPRNRTASGSPPGTCATEAGNNNEIFGPTSEVFHAVYGNPNVMSLTGAEHLAHRGPLNACFRPRAVRGYREGLLRATAARYIDAIRDRGEADANADILERISMRAIADVLGFIDVDDDTLVRWFHGYAAYLVDFGRSSEVAEPGQAIKAEVAAYLAGRLARLAAEPDGSTLSHLLHDGMPAGTTRSLDEIIGDTGVMIVGGFQEPAHGAANTLYGLFSRPDQAARFAADPAAWSAAAVEEGAALAGAVRHDREAHHGRCHRRRRAAPRPDRGRPGPRVG